jgi:hypothetical protein
MATLIVSLVLTWLVLIVFLWVWTAWFQGYIYTEPVEDLSWRAPAAGTAVMLFLFIWVWVDYSSQGRYRTLLDVNPTETVADYMELRVVTPDGSEATFRKVAGSSGKKEFRRDGLPDGPPIPINPERVIVRDPETGQDLEFLPERFTATDGSDKAGKFKPRNDNVLYYVNKESGREMRGDDLGVITSFRAGVFMGNLVINFLFFLVWFASLWFLLEFRWPHAFGLAVVFWIICELFLLPPALNRAESIASEQAKTAAASEPGTGN